MSIPIIYTAINQAVAQAVPSTAQHILDIGCGDGSFGAYIKQRQTCTVHGITFAEAEAQVAASKIDNVWVADLNAFNPNAIPDLYDCIICSHVLEHLYQPWVLVAQLQTLLKPQGQLIIAIPNTLFFKQRIKFLQGRFTYSLTGGIMDITHFRFFDWQSVNRVLQDSSLHLVSKKATGMFPQPVLRKIAPGIARAIDLKMVAWFPGLWGMQFILVAQKVV